MNTEDSSEPKNESRNIVMILVIAAVVLICCCVVSLIIFFAVAIPASRNLLKRATPTAMSLEEVNGGTALGKFYFGLDDIDDLCHITTKPYTFSQEEILKNEYIYLSVPFSAKYEGQEVQWDVYNVQGESILDGNKQPATLTSKMDHCLKGYISINPREKPGTYVLVVTHENKLAYRQAFTITASDLDKVPRPQRKAFGDISVGRDIHTTACAAGKQSASNTYTLDDIKTDPWFYLASPFQLSDIDKTIYWSVRNTKGTDIYHVKRKIQDNIKLCFWQGFSMEDSPAGKYTVIIKDDQSSILYQSDFELK